MNRVALFAFLGVLVSQTVAQSGYSAPQQGFSNGFGSSNGFNGGGNNGLGGGYSAPSNGGNGFNGGFNGRSNGFGGNGGRSSNGFGNGLSSGYGAPGVNPEIAALAENIPGGGIPGQDYPVLSEVPATGFQCRNQAISGYYADTAIAAGCQVFHICQLRESGLVQQDSFLCPNGTIFNQQYFVCDWWFNFDCSTAESFYSLNQQIGQTQNGYGNQVSSLNNGYGAPQNNGFRGGNNGGRNGFSNNGGYSNGGGSNGFSNGGGNGFSNGGGNGFSNGGGNGFSSGGGNGFQSGGYGG